MLDEVENPGQGQCRGPPLHGKPRKNASYTNALFDDPHAGMAPDEQSSTGYEPLSQATSTRSSAQVGWGA